MIEFEITSASRVGCVRRQNEDMILVDSHFVRNRDYATTATLKSEDRYIIAVADGMGGHNAGEVASELVMSNLKFFIGDLPLGMSSDEIEKTMRDWLNSIHQTVNGRGRSNHDMLQMGTTLVGLLYYGKRYFWMNCGDSRLYRLRNGELEQLTTDHSLNNVNGEKKHSNILTNCIGAGGETAYFDFMEITDDFLAGDTYLLCSDGLNDMVSDDIIKEQLLNGATANDLCEEAINAGGYDNVSACVLRIEK